MSNNASPFTELFSRNDYIFAYTTRPKKVSQLDFVDPAKATTAINAAITFLKSKDKNIWEFGVAANLDEISKKIGQISSELRALRVWFSDALDESVHKTFTTSIETSRNKLDAIVAGLDPKHPLDKNTQILLAQLIDTVSHSTKDLCESWTWGFSYLNQVVIGGTVALGAMALLARPRKEIRALSGKFTKYFEDANNPDIRKSIMNAYNSVAASLLQGEADLEARFGRWWTYASTSRHTSHSESYKFFHNDYIMVNGDPTNGIFGRPQLDSDNPVINNDVKHPWYPGDFRTEEAIVGDIQARLQIRSDQVAQLDMLKKYIEACGTIAQCLSSV